MKSNLQEIALGIFTLSIKNNVSLSTERTSARRMIGLIISVASLIMTTGGYLKTCLNILTLCGVHMKLTFLQQIKMQSYQSFILDFGCPVL